MINHPALDQAVRRFPRLLARIRRRLIVLQADLSEIEVEAIRREYALIVAEQTKAIGVKNA